MNNFVDHMDPTKSLGSMNIKAQYLIMKRRAIDVAFLFFATLQGKSLLFQYRYLN